MGRAKSPFCLIGLRLACLLRASFDFLKRFERLLFVQSSYFRFDMDDVYASCGGALSSKDDCNPTAYPEAVRSPLA